MFSFLILFGICRKNNRYVCICDCNDEIGGILKEFADN